MRTSLWPGSLSNHDAETRRFFEQDRAGLAVLIAVVDGQAVGFLELDRRKYAPGCERSPVMFIEGWFVEPHMRGAGVGRALVATAEALAMEAGFVEIASDSEFENTGAIEAHRALGFSEIERVVCFRKSLKRS
jgi:aminoglycoside 6'-N-acetyltransferase I